MPPYLILGIYVPLVWDAGEIGHYLTDFTAALGLRPHQDPAHGPIHWKSWISEELHAEVRRRTSKQKSAEGWHRDGDTTAGARMDCALVTWASQTPTEWRRRRRVYQPQPFEIVIARNLVACHRRPPGAPFRRWLFRQRVAVPRHLELP